LEEHVGALCAWLAVALMHAAVAAHASIVALKKFVRMAISQSEKDGGWSRHAPLPYDLHAHNP